VYLTFVHTPNASSTRPIEVHDNPCLRHLRIAGVQRRISPWYLSAIDFSHRGREATEERSFANPSTVISQKIPLTLVLSVAGFVFQT
jgi:hypothetical protein